MTLIQDQKNIEPKQLWLDNIPETIYIKDLKDKYKIKTTNKHINPVIGEYDDPYNQQQGIVNLDISNEGNIIIYGNADSGKETLLSGIIYDIMTTHTTEEAQMYILDFGSEALKIFKDSPHVGDVVFINDLEKLSRFFDMIQNELKNRKEILSEYNGDYNLYVNTNENVMPLIVVVMNNYESFAENYNMQYEDVFLSLTRECIKYGIVFVVTTSTFNDLRYRLSQNFKQKIALQLNKEDDYLNIFEKVGKKRPSHIFGRGLIKIKGENVYEFQTAKICEPEKWNMHIKGVIDEANIRNKIKAKDIPILPEQVNFEDVKKYLKSLSSVPIGIKKKNLEVLKYNFKKNLVNIITSKNIEDLAQFAMGIIEELDKIQNAKLIIIDSERIIKSQKSNLNEDFKKLIFEIETNNNNELICVILGIDKLISDLDGGESTFSKILKEAEELNNCNFIVIDNLNRLKNHAYDEWYKSNITGDTGIWVGNGVSDQYVISTGSSTKSLINNCGKSFGYDIKQGQATLVKLLGMKEKSEENE